MAKKLQDWHKAVLVFAGIFVVAIWAGFLEFPSTEEPLAYVPPAPTLETKPPSGLICQLGVTPTGIIQTYDKYNPSTATTTQNMYRIVGTNTWTDVAGAGTIQKAGYTNLEVVVGIDLDDDDGETYGPYFSSWTIPCADTYTWAIPTANDALSTDLATTWWDNNDEPNTNITSSAGNTYNLKFRVKGSYEEDYGNINGPDGEMGNLLIVQYNTTSIDDLVVTSITRTTNAAGTESTTTNYPVVAQNIPIHVSTNHSNTSMTLKGYKFPIVETSNEYYVYYFLDQDDTATLNTTYDRTRGGNPTFFIYDGNWYLNDDTGEIEFGFGDEDNANTGATGWDQIAIAFNSS